MTEAEEPFHFDRDLFSFMNKFTNASKYNQGPPLISDFGLQFPLVGRDETIKSIKDIFLQHIVAWYQNIADRKEHLIPVCANTPGIGKVCLMVLQDILK